MRMPHAQKIDVSQDLDYYKEPSDKTCISGCYESPPKAMGSQT